MIRLLDYANAVTPAIKDNSNLVSELVDSVAVLAVARLESFFVSLVSLGTRSREQEIRKRFHKDGHPTARTCDLVTLVRLVRHRISFKDDGKALDRLFKLVFERPAWPSDDVRELVLDLVLVQNLIVHNNGQDWSQDGVHEPAYALQFRRADVLTVRRYGDLSTYSLERYRALLFLRQAVEAIVEQARHLEKQFPPTALGPLDGETPTPNQA